MTEQRNPQAKLPPTEAIETLSALPGGTWFEYPVRAHPHHTDYAGIVWHGTYLTWMEEARVESLRAIGINFADLVNLGCDLPVVELSVRYHKPMQMGMDAVVRTRMTQMDGVRLNWEYQIQSVATGELFLTGLVTLVAVDRDKGKIMRRLPPAFKDALVKLSRE
ncbi:acyl-CoA thioesterase [Oxynema sp. CENA135]|uniref:acyl-CoA thioesterase n=1 Tax=Oxynema sp. CENA135 TaxID=984206 RepID=UPI001909E7C0|nr:thioesterase family protein [Oxynema sp. CENA135]MBK4731572.1 acyl-CoA thioesterase [Oxynema sp. CENA135]